MSPKFRLARAMARGLRPDPKIAADEWARENRVMPADAIEPGPYRPERTPYMIDIMRTMSATSSFIEGWFMKGTQLGGSVGGENLIGSWISTAAGNILVAFDGLENAKTWELTRFTPMRDSCKPLRRLIRDSNIKGADNTKLRKKFSGGMMRLIGSKAMPKSTTYRYVKVEEPDEIPWDVDGQGSFFDGLRARIRNFGRRAKMFGDSSPTIESASHIEREFKRGDRRRWHLFCPSCGHAQVLRWEQMKWISSEDPEETSDSVRYQCEGADCGALHTEGEWKLRNYARRPGMTEAECKAEGLAYWEATEKGTPGVASWHGGSLIAPIGWAPWPKLVMDYLDIGDDEDKAKSFCNNVKGLPYSYKQSNQLSAAQLDKLAEQYAMWTCPPGGLVCLAGVDTQDTWLQYVIRAYGRGEESWGIARGQLYGDTSQPEVWQKLREVLEASIKHASGQVMRVDAAFIDAGGHRTEYVKAFARQAALEGKHWLASFGAKDYHAPPLGKPRNVDFNWQGREVPGGVTIRYIGTQAIKNTIDARLRLGIATGKRLPGAGVFHVPIDFGSDYHKQMRSENRVLTKQKKDGKKLMVWQHTTNERNEDWDCEVLAYAAYLYAMQGRHAESVFKDRERVFAMARQGDLLDAAVAEAPTAETVQTSAQKPPASEPKKDSDALVQQSLKDFARVQELPPMKRPRRGFVNRY